MSSMPKGTAQEPSPAGGDELLRGEGNRVGGGGGKGESYTSGIAATKKKGSAWLKGGFRQEIIVLKHRQERRIPPLQRKRESIRGGREVPQREKKSGRLTIAPGKRPLFPYS